MLLGSKVSDVYASEVPAPDWGGKLLKSITITESQKTDKATFTYDEKKRLTRLVCESGYGDTNTYNFIYSDNQMNMIEEGGDLDFTMNIENGRVVSGTLNSVDYSGMSVMFTYDNNDHLVNYSLDFGSNSMITTFHWEGDNIVSVSNADDVDIFYTYTDKIAPPMLQKLLFGETYGGVSINNLAKNVCMTLYFSHDMCDKLISTMKVVDNDDEKSISRTYNYTYNYNSNGDISSFDVNDEHYELEWETYTTTPVPLEKPVFNSNSTIESEYSTSILESSGGCFWL